MRDKSERNRLGQLKWCQVDGCENVHAGFLKCDQHYAMPAAVPEPQGPMRPDRYAGRWAFGEVPRTFTVQSQLSPEEHARRAKNAAAVARSRAKKKAAV